MSFITTASPLHDNAGNAASSSGTAAITDLFPALVECFSVIVFGYLAARFGVITSTQSKGLGIYLSNFALPALFLKVMISIDFGDVSWKFVLAVSLAKTVVFVAVVMFVILLTRPLNLGMAGILSCFATQTNDVALGYPILLALYPKLANYIYLFAPAQLVILNPLSFVLLEWHSMHSSPPVEHVDNTTASPDQGTSLKEVVKKTDEEEHPASLPTVAKASIAWRIYLVVRGVILNPLVFTTFLGIIFNFILNHHIPLVIDRILAVLAKSFSATALFYLGANMVGKIGSLDRRSIYVLVFILLVKQILMPFITREIVRVIGPSTSNISAVDFNTMAFLYGALPTAPPVFLYASQYQVLPDVIATGLVLGTFLSAPFMYISARLVTIPLSGENDFKFVLGNTSFNISILSIIGCIWVLVIFLLSKRCFRMPHLLTNCLIGSIFLSCLGVVIGKAIKLMTPSPSILDDANKNYDEDKASFVHYLQFFIFFIGCTGARIWTALIVVAMAIFRLRSLCCLLKYRFAFLLTGFCLPPLITGLLLIASHNQRVKDIDPVFQYGRTQLIVSLIVLIACILTSVTFLVILQRSSNTHHWDFKDDESSPTMASLLLAEAEIRSSIDNSIKDPDNSTLLDQSWTGQRLQESGDCHELESWMSVRTCPEDVSTAEDRQHCVSLLARYRVNAPRPSCQVASSNQPISAEDELNEEFQMHRHLVLVILLLLTMFFGLFLCIWRLIKENITGIYVELEFLDSVFNFGQGVIVFAVFGLDSNLIVIPCRKRIYKLFYGVDEVSIPPEEFLDPEIRHIRDIFVRHHLATCESEIAQDSRYQLVHYKNVFQGRQLVDWLLAVGLGQDRLECVAYGQSLLYGRVLHHVTRRYSFMDLGHLYRFDESFSRDHPLPTSASDRD